MTDENSLAGRTMLVTGAASGFGFVMSTAFLEAGVVRSGRADDFPPNYVQRT